HALGEIDDLASLGRQQPRWSGAIGQLSRARPRSSAHGAGGTVRSERGARIPPGGSRIRGGTKCDAEKFKNGANPSLTCTSRTGGRACSFSAGATHDSPVPSQYPKEFPDGAGTLGLQTASLCCRSFLLATARKSRDFLMGAGQ